MSFDTGTLSIVLPALCAGALVIATHVPLGAQVLARGIVFIDLAIAQIAGCGVLLADALGFEPEGAAVQVAALASALLGALLLTWTEKRWPEVQEAIIGVVFVMAATAGVLFLASNVHGSEHLRDLLVGQILWVRPATLAMVAIVYAVILFVWLSWQDRIGRAGFYLLFACVVTISVQLVGVYLVFASLIVPPLATRRLVHRRLATAWALGLAGYVVGIALSVTLDWPTGPLIVWALAALGILVWALSARRSTVTRAPLAPSHSAAVRRRGAGSPSFEATSSPEDGGPGSPY
jgi:zinc/manganese transport system permease protein